jgi:hypothetical protein
MGGTAERAADSMSGRLERLQIQWEEMKEEIGLGVLPVLVEAGEGIQGVQRAAENLDSVLKNADGTTRWLNLIFNGNDFLGRWATSIEDGAAAQREAEQAALDLAVATDGAVLAHERHANATPPVVEGLEGIEGAAGDAGDEIKSLKDAVAGLFNPIRAVRKAEEDWEDAARRQAQALASGKGDTEAATEAGLDLAEAYVDMNVAAGQLDASGVLGFLQGISGQAGIAQSSIDGLKGSLDGLAGTLNGLSRLPPINIPVNVTSGTTRTRSDSQTRTIAGSVRNLVEN